MCILPVFIAVLLVPAATFEQSQSACVINDSRLIRQVAFERSQKEYDVLEARFKKLQIDFEQQLIACEQLNNENQSKASELKVHPAWWCVDLFYVYVVLYCF